MGVIFFFFVEVVRKASCISTFVRDYSFSRFRASGLESWVDFKCVVNNSAEIKFVVFRVFRVGLGLDSAG